jgi:PilZ domain-containing protein
LCRIFLPVIGGRLVFFCAGVKMLAGRETGMLQPPEERRTMRRFDMRLPAAVRLSETGAEEFFTETQNVSARGVFFYLDRPLEPGARINITLTFPPHVTLTDSVRVRFAARVIRIEPLPASRVGVAAMIEEYEFLRAAAGSDLLRGFSA